MQKIQRTGALVLATVAAAALTACGTPDPYGSNNYPVSQGPAPVTYPSTTSPNYVEYARVTNIQVVNPGENRSGVVGSVIGGVAGGAVGSQIGGGTGRVAATILGAIGGAVLGNRIDRGRGEANAVHRITLQTDQGAWRTYDVGPTDLSIGERVRIENGQIFRA
jgi:outer membrane lipoprotein SlyB